MRADAEPRLELHGLLRRPGGSNAVHDMVMNLAVAGAAALTGAIAVFLTSRYLHDVDGYEPAALRIGIIAIAVAALLAAPLRYPAEAPPARLVVVGLAIAMGLNGYWLGVQLANVIGDRGEAFMDVLALARWLLLISIPLAVFRPSFAVLPFLYIMLHEGMVVHVSGVFELGRNHYRPLTEVGVFLAVGLTMMAALKLGLGDAGKAARWRRLPADVWTTCAAVVLMVAIGAHFGNYFMSGVAKIILEGGPFTWPLENPTGALMLNGYNLGVAPLSFSPLVFGLAYEAFKVIELPLNIVTLTAQLFCFVAFWRRSWLIAVTLFFDCMHIAIFLLSGALFVHWIVLNSLIVAALAGERYVRPPWIAMLAGAVVTVAGHIVFYNARLGWYDSPQARYGYVVAVTAEGAEMRVPTSFYRESSYLFYRGHFGFKEYSRPSNHIQTGVWGQILHWAQAAPNRPLTSDQLMRQARDCAYQMPPVLAAEGTLYDYDLARAESFLRSQHERGLALADAGLIGGYNFYPHAHFSLPWFYQEFEAAELSDIVAYRYITETVCIEVKDHRVSRRVLAQDRGPLISVGNSGGVSQ